jgi:hypothetical protein
VRNAKSFVVCRPSAFVLDYVVVRDDGDTHLLHWTQKGFTGMSLFCSQSTFAGHFLKLCIRQTILSTISLVWFSHAMLPMMLALFLVVVAASPSFTISGDEFMRDGKPFRVKWCHLCYLIDQYQLCVDCFRGDPFLALHTGRLGIAIGSSCW